MNKQEEEEKREMGKGAKMGGKGKKIHIEMKELHYVYLAASHIYVYLNIISRQYSSLFFLRENPFIFSYDLKSCDDSVLNFVAQG